MIRQRKSLTFGYCTVCRIAVPLHPEFLAILDKIEMNQTAVSSVDKVLANHIYEYKKGVRGMILFTCNHRFEQQVCHRLCRQSIDYVVQPAGKENVNVYFGRKECLDAIRLFVTRPLNELTPEEDFILGAMLGYDICAQCERYCERKGKCGKCERMQ